jgi:hypothetical protein
MPVNGINILTTPTPAGWPPTKSLVIQLFNTRHEEKLRSTEGLVGLPTSWIREGRVYFWAVSGCTLAGIIHGIINGYPRLKMLLKPPSSYLGDFRGGHARIRAPPPTLCL